MSQVWSILSNKVLSLSSEMLSKARAIVYIILVVSLTSVTSVFVKQSMSLRGLL